MYPTTKFNIVDNSAIPSLPVEDASIYKVLEMIGFSSDQGPEGYRIVEGNEFFNLYGKNISFEKHGQPLLQAAMAINAGARLYCKRIVAEDAALANVGIVAVIENGEEDGEICLHYQAVTLKNAKGPDYEDHFKDFGPYIKRDFNSAVAATYLGDPKAEFNEEYYSSKITVDSASGEVTVNGPVYYPLFVIADNGRGVSTKSFRIIPDISGSKYYQFIKYQFEISQNNNTLETINFALDPSTSYEGKNLSIETAFRDSKQLIAKQNADIIIKFIEHIATILNISTDELARHDILTLKDNKNKALSVDTTTDNGVKKFTYVDSTNLGDYTFVDAGSQTATPGTGSASVTTEDFPAGDTTITFNAIDQGTVTEVSVTITASANDKNYTKTITLNEGSTWSGTLENVDLSGIDTLNLTYTATTADNIYTKSDTLATSENTCSISLADVTSWTISEDETEDEDTEDTTTDATFKEATITVTITMDGGDNGEFGNKPIEKEEAYNKRMIRVFGPDIEAKKGAYDNEIYDLDNIKIDVIVDANYSHGKEDQDNPNERSYDIKTAIQKFVDFREDCFYFADMGTDKRTFSSIETEEAKFINSKFTGIYHNSYNVVDPYSYKEITVTIGYNIAQLLVAHFATGRNKPFAGILYNNTISDVIDGTVNYIPARIMNASGEEENEKEALDDLRVNYASYYDGVFTIETEYTCQENYTQFSFLNNILLIQKLIKDIRSKCPKIRYSFMDGDDLTFYQQEVQKVIDAEAPNYLSVSFTYYEDETYAQNKIYYGGIEVKFRNFIQSEIFKVIAVG